MTNIDKLNQLNQLDITKITEIKMTSIGLLDVFGKLCIEIQIDNNNNVEIEFLSPVPKQEILKWLEENNLLDKATLIQF